MKLMAHLVCLALSLYAPLLAAKDPGDKRFEISGDAVLAEYQRSFSVKEFEALFTLETREVYNPWEKRTDSYTGIWLDDLAKKLTKDGAGKITFRAIDRYQIEFTPQDWNRYRILMATRVNGEYQPVKNKGPMRLVYADYDPDDVEHQLHLTKWMWLISSIQLD